MSSRWLAPRFQQGHGNGEALLLEPIMKVEIESPDEFAGTLMGDSAAAVAACQGTDSKGRTTIINAQVPCRDSLMDLLIP